MNADFGFMKYCSLRHLKLWLKCAVLHCNLGQMDVCVWMWGQLDVKKKKKNKSINKMNKLFTFIIKFIRRKILLNITKYKIFKYRYKLFIHYLFVIIRP